MKSLVTLIIIITTVTLAQNNTGNHSLKNIDCKTCHACEVPTKQNPCLVACPRNEMITVHQSPEEGPVEIVIEKLKDKYLPVNFSHKVHAQMSEMSGGCANCHHYNTAGPIISCSECHSIERKREDISKPDLEAAYHRQCINCHKEWSHSTDCNSCHQPAGSTLSKKESDGKDHPNVSEPERLIYETNYSKGKFVTFYHNDHTKLFKADCVSCHQDNNCTRCHDVSNIQIVSSNIPEKIRKSASEHHQPCFKCHENDKCSKCHIDKPAEPFNHKLSTGWALNRFHEILECTKCHGTGNNFARLDSNCNSCHNNFTPGSFEHKVTGLILDEVHSELECGDCHTENNFAVKPDCSACHDDKNYPADKPGNLVKLTKK